MRRRTFATLRAAAAAGLLPLLSACQSGLIYTHTWRPLSTNFDRTPVHAAKTEAAAGDVKHLSIPLVDGVSADVQWSSNAIGDVARHEGIEEICYADLETLSVLTVWNQYTVHVYGKPVAGTH